MDSASSVIVCRIYFPTLMSAYDEQACRTCGKRRGENIAEGTRCAACGRRHGMLLWLSVSVATAVSTLMQTASFRAAGATLVVASLATPPAFVLAVLLHELAHAAVAWLLGQTVTRVLVGEGRAVWRLGRDPELVFGSVVLGNGLTTVLDESPRGYRTRMCMMLVAAPAVSAAVAAAASAATVWSEFPVRLAWQIFGAANAVMAVITSIPVATFGGRVWSDVASAIYLLRADEAALEEHRLLSVQDRIAILGASGLHDRAIDVARASVATAPSAGLAHGLLACALHNGGRLEEAREVARHALGLPIDAASRGYLAQFVEPSFPPPRA